MSVAIMSNVGFAVSGLCTKSSIQIVGITCLTQSEAYPKPISLSHDSAIAPFESDLVHSVCSA